MSRRKLTPAEAIGYLVTKPGVAVLAVRHPPVNAISYAVRDGLVKRIEQAEKDERVKSIVIYGEGRTFPAGADISEFSDPTVPRDRPLHKVCDRIEASSKPVVAAVHGTAYGGGFEIALSCHYRLSTSNTRFGLPEVTLGIIPGAGGTQRLPRVIGVEKALQFTSTGTPIPASLAHKLGVTSKVVQAAPQFRGKPQESEALLHEAIDFAASIQDTPFEDRRVTSRPAKQVPQEVYDKQIAALKKNRKIRGQKAPFGAVEAVRASTLPYEQGIRREQEVQAGLRSAGAQGPSLQHLFFAQRAVNKISDVDMRTKVPIKTVGVIGAGVMGGGIAMNFVMAGYPTVLIEAKQEYLDRGLGTIKKNFDISVKRGRFTKEQVDKWLSLITPSLDYADLGQVDMVVEAVFELMDLKKEIFKKLDAATKPDALLCSNTSALNVDEIASVTKRPDKVMGMHFFSPANIMQLVENVRGAKTSDVTIATVMDVTKRINKIGVLVRNCYGFVGNRIRAAYGGELAYIVEDGAYPEDVDRVLYEEFGMAMGPFQTSDLVGLDLGWRGRKQRGLTDPNSKVRKELKGRYGATITDRLCEMGRFGMKNGKGWYDYSENPRRGKVDPIVTQTINEVSKDLGIQRRTFSADEIIERCICSMVNVGCQILEEGYADKPSDIDVIKIFGYGFPKHRGGLMFWADEYGLDKVYATVKKYGDMHPDIRYWKMSPLLEHCAQNGLKIREYWAQKDRKSKL